MPSRDTTRSGSRRSPGPTTSTQVRATFTDWVVFKQDPPQRGGSDLAPSYAVVPGSTSYTFGPVPAGNYVVWTQYMWYTGTWVDLSNWSKTGSYEYARVGVGAFAGPYIQDSCPVSM